MRTVIKFVIPLLVAALLVGIYVIKVETWQLQRDARKMERQIEGVEREISILRAEKAYLSRPERIEKLARQFLKMRPPNPAQIIVQEK
ncbi:MAG: cell division protein FtsL [Hyphomicrobiaceae bacterium]|nr:cell division protein FtsL [Hyphomicrobiaceae bacterium]